jgi:adenine-specific DNA-methyltransferase
MRYFGSKATTVDRVYELIAERIPSGTFCDAFGGLGFVGSHFKSKGYKVWTGDILTFAHYFQLSRIQLDRTVSFRRLRSNMRLDTIGDVIDTLNTLKPRNGWLVEEYAKKRMFFTLENAMRAQSCRLQIDSWSRSKWLNSHERAVLLASLINSMDRVANTAGTYYAYLKSWHRKALLPFRFELIRPAKGNPDCSSVLADAKDLVASRKFDILYLDPPYNERSYSTYLYVVRSFWTQSVEK